MTVASVDLPSANRLNRHHTSPTRQPNLIPVSTSLRPSVVGNTGRAHIPDDNQMSISWHKRKTRLSSAIGADGGEDAEALVLDQLMHGQSVIGKTGKCVFNF